MIVYIATAINTFFFVPMRKSILFIFALPEPVYKLVLTFFTLVTGGFRGRPMWGTFLVWDARFTSVFISFLIYQVPMPIPILSNFENFPFETFILFVLETRLPIQSFIESPFTEEIEAREKEYQNSPS